MLRLETVLDRDGVVVEYRASGHAGNGYRGSDVVCAAVSALSRAFVEALRDREGVRVHVDAPERGQLSVELSYDGGARAFLQGAGAVLLEGLSSVVEEYPEFCKLTMK
jgi:uncharacterized protein YsxB (DUF464 family)